MTRDEAVVALAESMHVANGQGCGDGIEIDQHMARHWRTAGGYVDALADAGLAIGPADALADGLALHAEYESRRGWAIEAMDELLELRATAAALEGGDR